MGEAGEEGRGPLWLVSLLLGLVLCAAVGYLQWRALFQGYTQSFDAMIYIRSLWGMAHGDLHNSVREVPSLTIHNNLLLFALAPLARLLHPGAVLVAGQALSLGAAASLLGWRFGRAWRDLRANDKKSPVWALWAGLVLTLGTPLVLNPFLYDLHPEVMGLPWMLACLLRAVDEGHFDGKALLLALPAVLLREEYALVLGAAVFLAPGGVAGPSWWSTWRGRFTAAAAAGAYFALYYVLAAWTGEVWSTAALKFSGGEPSQSLDVGSFLHSKLVLLAAVGLSAGGLWWRGWRWAGALAPGLAFLLVNQHMAQQQVRFHYGFLVAAGLCAASYAGWRAWLSQAPQGGRRWGQLALWTLLAAVGFMVFSSAPGGGQFWATAYDLKAEDGSLRLDPGQHGPVLGVHRMLERIPAQDAVAAPWSLGAPLSAREKIRVDLHIMDYMKTNGAPPPWLDTLVLRRREWGNTGRFLTGAHGFRLAARSHDTVILTRSPRMEGVRLGVEDISSELPPGPCAQPLGRWPDQGLALCHVKQWPDGRWAVTIKREREAARPYPRLDVLLRSQSQQIAPTWLMQGLLGAEGLPVGSATAFVSPGPLPWSPSEVTLAPPGGQPVQARAASGVLGDALPLGDAPAR